MSVYTLCRQAGVILRLISVKTPLEGGGAAGRGRKKDMILNFFTHFSSISEGAGPVN